MQKEEKMVEKEEGRRGIKGCERTFQVSSPSFSLTGSPSGSVLFLLPPHGGVSWLSRAGRIEAQIAP
jgi:hypothetical protein